MGRVRCRYMGQLRSEYYYVPAGADLFRFNRPATSRRPPRRSRQPHGLWPSWGTQFPAGQTPRLRRWSLLF